MKHLQRKKNFINSVINGIGYPREIIMMGDFNGRTGSRTWSEVVFVGPYGEDRVNDNGERLIEICEQYSLRITNGFYQHKAEISNRLHYFWIKTGLKVQDVRFFRDLSCGSDHFLVYSKILFPYMKSTEGKSETSEIRSPPRHYTELLMIVFYTSTVRDWMKK